MRKSSRPTVWTEEMDSRLRDIWFTRSTEKCAEVMGLTVERLLTRAAKLGLPRRGTKQYRDYSRRVWVAAATRAAMGSGVDVDEVLTGVKRPEVVQVRWRAWDEIARTGACSLGQLALASGFDHSSITYGLARLRGLSAKYLKAHDIRWAHARWAHAPILEAAE